MAHVHILPYSSHIDNLHSLGDSLLEFIDGLLKVNNLYDIRCELKHNVVTIPSISGLNDGPSYIKVHTLLDIPSISQYVSISREANDALFSDMNLIDGQKAGF
jgi:hypothetical protein